jgi:hypothetical protein
MSAPHLIVSIIMTTAFVAVAVAVTVVIVVITHQESFEFRILDQKPVPVLEESILVPLVERIPSLWCLLESSEPRRCARPVRKACETHLRE